MKLLNNYEVENDVICKLLKFIYNLKQVSQVWVTILQEFLIKHDFWKLKADYCVYTNNDFIIFIYIDNFFIINKSSDFKILSNFKKKLNKQFKMIDFDLAKYYFDIEIIYLSDRFLLIQTIFIDEIFE